MGNIKIPDAVIRRLPKYYRYLEELEKKGEQRISSAMMSRALGLGAPQIRQDLNNFGGFGLQGYGYDVTYLKEKIAEILGFNQNRSIVIVGAGNIGRALARNKGVEKEGFRVVAIFDNSEEVIGRKVGDFTVADIEQIGPFLTENAVDIGVICTSVTEAQKIADILAQYGVCGIWNFAPTDIAVKNGVAVENVHLSDSLFALSYHMNEEKSGN